MNTVDRLEHLKTRSLHGYLSLSGLFLATLLFKAELDDIQFSSVSVDA